MAADISRVRFDPLRDYAGVVLQQGRLLLDSDFNELVAVLERRLRAETSDLTSFGPDPDLAGVAWVPRQTPNAFLITASGGSLSIGRGRMYVDGLLAENHGVEVEGFDPLLSERTGTVDTSYLAQPYWPTPAPLPTEGTHLAYLDVWRRELTHLEDPGLVEVAVGVDATARWQTAWQVRLHAVPSGTTCTTDDGDIPGWHDVIRPSDGRLTTHEVAVPTSADPCELPPEGGYRGLENQTYRVEIHEGGQPGGTATFKWSRENASVAMPVVEMVSTTVLRLASVGRDDVLRVSNDDWVEILDDRRELDGEPGEMRQVTVDDAERTITFSGALPADLQPADADEAAARHLRVRRWDSDGLVAVPASDATEVALEHGIAVSFSVATSGGRFRRGDHWIFAARTADASFEQLEDAPPLGVHHHYARLAVVTLPSSATSCRRLWPPLPTEGGDSCDCTVCVTPESHSSGALTVQDAVDAVKTAGGGTVCIAAGVYDIAGGVEVDGARSLRIRGQGLATILVARGTALTVRQSLGVTVENLALVSGADAPAAVRLQGVALTNVVETAILSFPSGDAGGAAIQLAGVGLLVNLRRNVLVARTGVGIGGGDSIGLFGAGLGIEDNVVLAFDQGIDLGGTAAYLLDCRVTGNDVVAPQEAGIRATGALAPGGSLEIGRNRIAARGSGIIVGADATVDANTINTLGGDPGADGIVVDPGTLTVEPGHVRITGNRVHDRGGTGVALRTSVRTFMVKQNVLSTVGAGIAIEDKGQAERVAIEDNEVFDVATGEPSTRFVAGIHVAASGSAAIVANTVARLAPGFRDGAELAGILATATEDVRISGNVVDEIGPQDGYEGFAAGIAVVGPFERASVSDNAVRFGPGVPGPVNGTWWALLIQSAGEVRTRVASAAVVPLEGGGALALTNRGVFAVAARGDHAGVAANTMTGGGGGNEPACRVRVGGDVVADANQCRHERAEDPTAMLLQGSSVIATGNRLRGEEAMLIIRTDENRLAAVGNLAPGGTHLNNPGSGLPSPWQPLNPNVS